MSSDNAVAPSSRREMLARCTHGFGAIALSALFGDRLASDLNVQGIAAPRTQAAAKTATATKVIFLFMDGGPSQVDTFDPKPRLDKEHGKPIGIMTPATQFAQIGNILRSPWRFRQRGESGIPVSDLFPHTGRLIDHIAVIRSMVADFSEHTNANYLMHTGRGQRGYPSVGSWISYALGLESQNLPGFIVLDSGLFPPGGNGCFDNGFLPSGMRGSIFTRGAEPLANTRRADASESLQKAKLATLYRLNRHAENDASRDRLEAAIANYELAARMQLAVPEIVDLRRESAVTMKLYGCDAKATEVYGKQCVLARRLIEQGVQFVEILCPRLPADRWDQHSHLKEGHEQNARATDKPIAGLLTDLEGRGLLKETLVIWAGEFGRTPMAQSADGRDHNPFGFSIWLAGGGVKGGITYGATDDYGYFAVENKVHVHDLHATILHLLGIDHAGLTFRFGSRDVRLTDVDGAVVDGILA